MDNDLDRRLILGAAGLAGAAALARLAHGGPLTPPAGSVGPTGRTLLEVEPRIPIGPATTPGDSLSLYRITQPGSYYLTGDVQGVAGKHGIVIATGRVTIDLMGFELRGVGAAGFGYTGIKTGSGFGTETQLCIRNGRINNWDRSGIDIAAESTVQNVAMTGNLYRGIEVTSSSKICDCTVSGGQICIDASGWGCVVSRCAVRDASNSGFSAVQGTVLVNCTATGCVTGFNSSAAVVIDCTAAVNSGSGFSCGILGTISRCNAYNNLGNGITCVDNCSVLDCTSTNNYLHGISAGNECHLRGNTCASNGTGATTGHGINVTGARCRVEANHCAHNDNGINITGTSNLIIRNSVSGNTVNGYAIAAGNMFGPNVYPASNLINTGTNPHANYEM